MKIDEKQRECMLLCADKTLGLWCLLDFREEEKRAQIWIVSLYKYVRYGSSSSEWYDGYKLRSGDICLEDYRTWEFKFISLRNRESMYREPDEKWEYISDALVEKYFIVLGKPLDYWDLSYIYETHRREEVRSEEVPTIWMKIGVVLLKDVSLFRKNILERPEELVDLVLVFLKEIHFIRTNK